MPLPDQQIKIVRAQDLTLRFTMESTQAITGWAVSFTVKLSSGGSALITKTVGSGVTLTDATRGIISVAIAKADIDDLDVNEDLDEGVTYRWDLKRTDSGANTVLARGEFVLEQEVTS